MLIRMEKNFTAAKEELNAFFGINFVVAISKLPTTAEYWRIDNLIGNDSIQNTVIFVRFFKIYILQITEKTIKQTRLSRWNQ